MERRLAVQSLCCTAAVGIKSSDIRVAQSKRAAVVVLCHIISVQVSARAQWCVSASTVASSSLFISALYACRCMRAFSTRRSSQLRCRQPKAHRLQHDEVLRRRIALRPLLVLVRVPDDRQLRGSHKHKPGARVSRHPTQLHSAAPAHAAAPRLAERLLQVVLLGAQRHAQQLRATGRAGSQHP